MPTSTGPRRVISSTIARQRTRPEPNRVEVDGLAVTSGHSCPAVLASPARAPAMGSIGAGQALNSERAIESGDRQERRTAREPGCGAKVRPQWIRRNARLTNEGSTPSVGASTISPATRSPCSREAHLPSSGSLGPDGLASSRIDRTACRQGRTIVGQPDLGLRERASAVRDPPGRHRDRPRDAAGRGGPPGRAVGDRMGGRRFRGLRRPSGESHGRDSAPPCRRGTRRSGGGCGASRGARAYRRRPGSRSWSAERISTRLIESIPRSASSCMSSSSISTG